MKAVTIRVNDVDGVGGFVLPGDRVDVVLTRQIDKGSATTEVVLQNTRVLAIDQNADERAGKASVAKSVTLEVSTVQAQKVWLASSVGTLSLLLRKAGETTEAKTRKVTLKDLGSDEPLGTDRSQQRDGGGHARGEPNSRTPCRPREMGPWSTRKAGGGRPGSNRFSNR